MAILDRRVTSWSSTRSMNAIDAPERPEEPVPLYHQGIGHTLQRALLSARAFSLSRVTRPRQWLHSGPRDFHPGQTVINRGHFCPLTTSQWPAKSAKLRAICSTREQNVTSAHRERLAQLNFGQIRTS